MRHRHIEHGYLFPGGRNMLFRRHQLRNIPQAVLHICRTLHDAGYLAFVVGGAVRDSLRHLQPGDWDVATDALPATVQSLFAKTIPTGIKYGTVTVIYDNTAVEVTTFRSEGIYRDGRRPESVTFGTSIEEDLKRRDFTVNAIAYDPITGRFCDPFGGRRDLRRHLLRAVGDPVERFQEDGLRMLRFFRFLATLNLRPDRNTLAAVQPHLIRRISQERIGDELSKLLLAEKPSRGLLPMHKSGLLQEIIPELSRCDGVTQGNLHRWDVLHHLIYAADYALPDLPLRWAALLHDIAKPVTRFVDEKGIHFYQHEVKGAAMARSILQRLRYDKQTIKKVAFLVRWHMFSVHFRSTDRALRRFLHKVGKDNIFDLLELRRADILALGKQDDRLAWLAWNGLKQRLEDILAEENALSVKDLAINGRDVMEVLGIPPGPEVGQALEWLLEQVLDDPSLNEPSQLINMLKTYRRTCDM